MVHLKNPDGSLICRNDEVPVEWEEVTWNEQSNPWSTLSIGNGDMVRLKVVVSGVWRALNMDSPDGKNVYYIASQNMTAVQSAPQKAKKDPRLVR